MFQLSNPIMQTGKNSSVKVRQHKKLGRSFKVIMTLTRKSSERNSSCREQIFNKTTF